MSRRILGTFASLAALISASFAANGQAVKTTAHPSVRVTDKVNPAVVATLAGTHPAIVASAQVGARVASSTPFKHMILVLQPSADQEYALRTLLDSQQDKTSPNYHQWLTPQTFGTSFGVASTDVASVKSWLQDSGFSVESVSKSSRFIVFSGTAGTVESAFHTEMHTITVNGESHVSNTVDISVPAALASVVKGVASLNNFFPKSNVVNPHTAQVSTNIPANNYITADTKPLYTSTSSNAHYVTPGDAATIFDSTPLLNGGIDGSGQTIAVIGQTDINLSDVQQFRSMFGLPKQDPTITVIGEDPGTTGDDIEAYLDVEWSGAMAPKANINFINSGSDYFTNSGIDNSSLYAVENNLADIITLSYGGCETANGTSGTYFYNSIWEQAAAQGQSVFVSSGDSGAAGCSSSSAATGPAYGVNALGSSAYNVAVGGSMFVDYGASQYWNGGVAAPAPAGYNFATATSYIPEAAWNEGALTTTLLNVASTAPVAGAGIEGGGGGISIYTARPSWQTGSGISATADSKSSTGTGIAAGSPITGVHRLVPDIAFIAAGGHDGTVFCAEGVCTNSSGGYGIGVVGGTSVATPVMASVQALINQRNGGRQGNPNFHYYPLANADFTAGTGCQAVNGTATSSTVTLPAASCNFHDIVAGSNRVPSKAGDTVGLGFDAGAGFDAATGLGSVNIANVATNWSTVGFRSTTTSINLSPTTGIAHGANQILSSTVTAGSGSGTPTGDISLIVELPNVGANTVGTLTDGAISGTVNYLPGGSYNVHVHYSGDGTFAPSDSPSVPVTIAKEASNVTFALSYFASGTYTTAPTTIPYGNVVDLIATAAGTSNNGIPTGKFTFSVSQGATALPGLTGTLDSNSSAALIAGAGYPGILIAPNYPALSPGTYAVTAAYSGDSSFGASTATTSIVIAKATPVGTLTSSSSFINSSNTVQLTYSLARVSGTALATLAAYPTGSIVFTDTTSGAALGTATLNSLGVATLSTNAITTNGANTITAVYSGDANYNTITTTGTVTVGALTTTSTAVTVAAGTYYVSSTVPLVATVSPAVAGTVRFYDGTTLLGSAVSSGTTGIATLNSTALAAGTHTITATFVGTSAYASSTGTGSANIAQNITSLALDAPVASIYGQTIALAGRIARSPSTTAAPAVGLTGTITFKDGSTTIGTATPIFLPGGYAYYTGTASIATLAAGTHTFTAVYSGDANYATSSSPSVTTTIAQLNPTLALTAPVSVYASSASIPLTATLPISNALAAPTAQVTFYNGSMSLGSVTLTYSAAAGAYVATLTASSLGTGPHVLTAAYPGDANYTATSGTLNLLVTTNNVWVANGSGSVSALTASGSALTPVAVSGGGTAIAIDGSGNVWSLNKSANSIAEFTNAGAVISSGYKVGGIAAPSSLVIDGAGIVWIANGDGTISGVNSANGTAVNPTAYNVGSSIPTSIVVDGSGNLWLTNSGDNTVTEVLGAATPAMTPTTIAVKTNTLAVKP